MKNRTCKANNESRSKKVTNIVTDDSVCSENQSSSSYQTIKLVTESSSYSKKDNLNDPFLKPVELN